MRKRTIAAALALALVIAVSLGLTGCAGGADSGQVLKIGVIVNQTDWFAPFDLNNMYEIESYAKVLNAQGGIKVGDKTYTIELLIEDGKSSADSVKTAAMRLVDEDVHYVIGTADFMMSTAAELFEQKGIMYFTNYAAGDPSFFNGGANKHAFSSNSGMAGDIFSAIFTLKTQYPEVQTVALCVNDDGTQDIKGMIAAQFCDALGLTYVDSPIIYSPTITDMAPIALQVTNTAVDAIVGTGTLPNHGSLLKEMRSIGDDTVYAQIIGQPGKNMITVAGAEASDNAFTLGLSLDPADNTEIINKIVTQLRADKGDEVADTFTGNSCNALHELIWAMQKAGSIEVQDVIAAWESSETIETIYGVGNIGGVETTGINHSVGCPAPVTKLVKGEAVFVGFVENRIP